MKIKEIPVESLFVGDIMAMHLVIPTEISGRTKHYQPGCRLGASQVKKIQETLHPKFMVKVEDRG